MFKKYLHIERFGNVEVEGIELGQVYVFPKIDGTNGSVYLGEGGRIEAGSRNRELSLEADNAGFLDWVLTQPSFCDFFAAFPKLRLYGEWLVPHTFKGYRPEAWKKFYIFDVYNDETDQYLEYDVYRPILEDHKLEFVAPLAIIKNGDYTRFMEWVDKNFFLCPDGGSPGEGIVLKNYNYQNRFGRQCFAKLIRNEFKEMHNRTMGAPEIEGGQMNEEIIAQKFTTLALIDKTIAKITLDNGGWDSKCIPRLLETVFYEIVKEELWDGLKLIKFGTVNFKTLKAFVIQQIKSLKKEIF